MHKLQSRERLSEDNLEATVDVSDAKTKIAYAQAAALVEIAELLRFIEDHLRGIARG